MMMMHFSCNINLMIIDFNQCISTIIKSFKIGCKYLQPILI
jgi:hypothetical protein